MIIACNKMIPDPWGRLTYLILFDSIFKLWQRGAKVNGHGKNVTGRLSPRVHLCHSSFKSLSWLDPTLCVFDELYQTVPQSVVSLNQTCTARHNHMSDKHIGVNNYTDAVHLQLLSDVGVLYLLLRTLRQLH
jgi:hypothetical protein